MIYYNSWDLSCKYPFGAVRINKSVTFNIHAGHCDFAYLCTDTMGEFKMSRQAARFSVTITPNQTGLIFYYFKLITDNGITIYAGKDKGGQAYFSKELPKPYQLTVYPESPPLPDWYKEGIAYQIFPDRFNIGGGIRKTKPNSYLYNSWSDTPHYIKSGNHIDKWDFFGGNLQGITEKLDYLKSLNVTVIYLNPIFEANSNHRYNTGDYSKLDSLLGNDEDYQNLIKKANELNIKIILDGVFNHTGADSLYFNKFGNYNSNGACQSKNSPYCSWYKFKNYPCEYECWWGIDDLPHVDESNHDFLEFLLTGENSIIKKWTKTGIGGWRIDVADELPDAFLESLNKTVKEVNKDTIIIGEVWEDASNKISYNQLRTYFTKKELDCVMNYPLRNNMIAFLRGEITAKELQCRFLTQMENYPEENYAGNFNILGTHDVERIITVLKDINQNNYINLLKQIVNIQFAFPGIPCIYYGDEAGLEGYKDPDNRKTFPWGHENKEVFEIYKQASDMRANTPVLKNGITHFTSYGNNVFGIIRINQNQKFGLFINRSDIEISFDCDILKSQIKIFPNGYCIKEVT